VRQLGGGHGVQHGRGHGDDGDPAGGQEVDQLRADQRRGQELERSAGGERAEDLPDREVERDRGELEHAIGRVEIEVGDLGRDEVDCRAVRDDGALRLAGGAGGRDDVRGIVGMDRGARR
jgi:hypothetical protein